MAYGSWGGKFPILNQIVSRSVFYLIGWRLAFLRSKNLVRDYTKGRNKQSAVNSIETARELSNWMSRGFDKLNIGGGSKNLSGFINIDFVAHPTVEREVVANILNLSFIPSDCMSHIHSNHVIEHLSESELLAQLAEYRRILRNEGLLTLRCPNTLGVAYGFWFEPILEQEKSEFLKLGFPEEEDFGNSKDRWLHRDIYAFVHWIYGDVGNIENQHLNQITPTKLKRYLELSGFEIIKVTDPESLNIVVVARSGQVKLQN